MGPASVFEEEAEEEEDLVYPVSRAFPADLEVEAELICHRELPVLMTPILLERFNIRILTEASSR